MALPHKLSFALAAACLLGAQGAAAQHITIDGRFSPAQTLAGPNYAITANVGKQVGSNLFHSFGQFGLATGESAAFSGPATISNVIGRVTGGNPSAIDGKIQSNIAGANLYLINPSGIVFGPNATVNVSGSFHTSTADYLKMSDGAKFQATNPDGSILSAAPPAAFGFLNASPAAITVTGSTLGPMPRTLGVVAGPVSITGATLSAPAGTIHVTSVAGTGEVPVDPRNTPALTVKNFGPVDIKGGSTLDVGNPGGLGAGGSVFIHAGALTISSSEIGADNYGSGAGGAIALRGETQVALANDAYVHALTIDGTGAGIAISTSPSGIMSADASTVLAGSVGSGSAGPISVSAGQLTLTSGAILGSVAAGTGRGGDISVAFTDRLLIDGSSGPPLRVGIPATGIASITRATSPTGSAGNITLKAGSLSILNGGGIASSTFGSAGSGNVSANVTGQLAIDQSSVTGIKLGVILGIESQANPDSKGNAGDVAIKAGTLTIMNSGQVGSPTFGGGGGGNVSVNVVDLLTIDGSKAIQPFVAGVFASAQPGSGGNAGNVSITAGQLSITNGVIFNGAVGAIGTTPASTGNAGNITVKVTGPSSIEGPESGIRANTDVGTRGNAGDVVVNAGSLSITNSGTITALTKGAGHGGSVTVGADSLSLSGGGTISSNTYASIPAGTSAVNNAGPVTVAANNLTITTNGQIGSGTFGSGDAGSVSVSVPGTLTIDGTAATVLTGIASNNAVATSSGNAGAVTVSAGTLNIRTNGQITSGTFGSGNAGSISVNVSDALTINGINANPKFLTGISTDAEAGSKGNGGSVMVQVSPGSLAVTNGGIISASTSGTGNAGEVKVSANTLTLAGGSISSETFGSGGGGNVSVRSGALTIVDGAIANETFGPGNGGNIDIDVATDLSLTAGASGFARISTVSLLPTGSAFSGTGNAGNITIGVAGKLSLNGGESGLTTITADTLGTTGNGGNVTIRSGSLNLISESEISSNTQFGAGRFGLGRAGRVVVTVDGQLSIDGGSQGIALISSSSGSSSGDAGSLAITARDLTIVNGGQIATTTLGTAPPAGSGKAGFITVNVADSLMIDGTKTPTGITGMRSDAREGSTGNAGKIAVTTGALSIVNNGTISTATFEAGHGGDVSVIVNGPLSIDATSANATGILADAEPGSRGDAGSVNVAAGTAILRGGAVSSSTAGSGNGGTVSVVTGTLSLANLGAISSATFGSGNGGNVSVSVAGQLSIDGAPGDFLTGITATSEPGSTGNAGNVMARAGAASIANNKGEISSSTFGSGNGGNVSVDVAGLLAIDGGPATLLTGIAAQSSLGTTGNAGSVTVNAGELSIVDNGQISVRTQGSGTGGNVAVTAAGPISLGSGAQITAATGGAGIGGTVRVSAEGPLSLSDPGSGIIASATASGNAGSVTVGAPQITVTTGAEISSTTAGTGAGGSVDVTTPGTLVLNGMGDPNTEIAASAMGPKSGPGGNVMVAAGSLTIESGAQIASTTAGPGRGGDVDVKIADAVTLTGVAADGTASGITAAALPGSSGRAGEVVLTVGGALALLGGAEVSSSTAGAGDGGSVQVAARGSLTLTDPRSGIVASAESAAGGDAGSVTVRASKIALISGAEIASTTAGTGAGGSVSVMTPGTLVLNGNGDRATQIATSAIGPQSGPGGSVRVAANSLTVEGGAQIASSTAGPGKGGDVNVVTASDVVLPDPGPQITAQSTGSGDAGSISVSAVRLLISNGGAISTEARTSTASGGNITLAVRDFLYLTSSEISTSVKGEKGNGGNIAIDPQLVILEHSSIIAQAVEGHGGNITINAGQFIQSSDSIVSASSQLGISGTVEILGPRVDVNGALVVLSTQLRSRTEVLRQACAALAGQPISSLVEAGRGGLPQDPEATLPALYIAGRDLAPSPPAAAGPTEASGALQTTIHLTMRCG